MKVIKFIIHSTYGGDSVHVGLELEAVAHQAVNLAALVRVLQRNLAHIKQIGCD